MFSVLYILTINKKVVKQNIITYLHNLGYINMAYKSTKQFYNVIIWPTVTVQPPSGLTQDLWLVSTTTLSLKTYKSIIARA